MLFLLFAEKGKAGIKSKKKKKERFRQIALVRFRLVIVRMDSARYSEAKLIFFLAAFD